MAFPAAVVLLVLGLACVVNCEVEIVGSTAIRRVMDSITRESPVLASYDAEGTGAGQDAFIDGAADIGTGDLPLPKELFEEDFGVHIPAMVGGIAFGFKLEGIKSLKLTACNLAAIYQGDITNWGDDELVENNPGLEDMNLVITPIARSDSSGSTAIVSRYLNESCRAWQLGVGNTIDWPDVVTAVDQSSQVVERVAGTEGAIGYAAIQRFSEDIEAKIETADGIFDSPSDANFENLDNDELPAPMEDWSEVEFIFDEGSYPTTFVAYFYVPLDTTRDVVTFVKFVLSKPVQSSLTEYGFFPLPKNLKEAADAAVAVLENKL